MDNSFFHKTSRTFFLQLFALCMVYIGHASEGKGVAFYVATNGNDANMGTIDNPFATLQRARDAVRGVKNKEGIPSIEIIIREGVYYIDETLLLEPKDSGTEGASVVWRSADGEKVVLNGGKEIIGKWEKGSHGIWAVDLLEAKGWKRNMDIPEVYKAKPDSPWNFRQLYVEGKRAIRARYPNENEKNPFLYATGGSMDHIELAPGQVKKSWAEAEDAQVNIVPNWRFFNQWNDIAGIDREKSSIFLGARERHGKIIKGNWFWVEGVFEELDHPGEWYLDHKKGKLYYMPDPEVDPNTLKFTAPWLNRIVYLKGDVNAGTHVKYITFKDLEFRNTTFTIGQIEARVDTDGAVMFENASHCRIDSCHFENLGGYAHWLHLDSKYNVFHNNVVLNSGGGGVLMTGSRLSYMDDSKVFTPGEAAAKVFPVLCEITNNTVENCGKIRYYGGGVHMDSRPASMAMDPGNYIAHNLFQNLSRNGIFAFRNQGGNIIEFNDIHDCMQTTIDGATIHFATMNRLSAPNYILDNYLYDIWGYEQKPNGKPIRTLANGVFLDWATSNTTVRRNFIYNTGGKEIKPIFGNWNLHLEDNFISKSKIVPPFIDQIGPKGTISHGIQTKDQRVTGGVIHYGNKELVALTGKWQPVSETGMSDLFDFNYMIAQSGNPAEATFQLPIQKNGKYKVVLMYSPNDKNTTNATLTIYHADGKDVVPWNMKEGDVHGFALKIGEYQFTKGKPMKVVISNQGADGRVVADAVAFVKTDKL